jgi:hypothetical protein
MRKKFEVTGWILFTCGSLIFLIDNLLNHNLNGIVGSLAFLAGCLFFIFAERTG